MSTSIFRSRSTKLSKRLFATSFQNPPVHRISLFCNSFKQSSHFYSNTPHHYHSTRAFANQTHSNNTTTENNNDSTTIEKQPSEEQNEMAEPTNGDPTEDTATDQIEDLHEEIQGLNEKESEKKDSKPRNFMKRIFSTLRGSGVNTTSSDTQKLKQNKLNQIRELEAEVKKFKEGMARSQADLLNYRNMAEKDLDNARTFATKSFSKDILAVADAINAAISAFEEEEKEEEKKIVGGEKEFEDLFTGVKLTQKTLIDTLNRHGIRRMDPLGKEFNPNFHEALFQQPSDKYEPDHVMRVVIDGYCIKNHVLRPAKVGVALPMPKPVEKEKEKEGEEQEEKSGKQGDDVEDESKSKRGGEE